MEFVTTLYLYLKVLSRRIEKVRKKIDFVNDLKSLSDFLLNSLNTQKREKEERNLKVLFGVCVFPVRPGLRRV